MRKKKEKPFRVFDGEGYTFPDGSHRMILLANSDGDYVENAQGLSTTDCLEFLTKQRPPAIATWFAFGYDVNKMLCDVPLRGEKHSLECLWKNGRTWWHGSFIKYIPRKFFTVRHKKQSFHSCDTFSFFQQAFLKACKEWNIDAERIVAGKEARGEFATWTLDQIRAYNFEELRIAKDLLDQLRESFRSVNLVPQSWHGPGAIAMTWLQREGLSVHYSVPPSSMVIPIRHAYFGGRIDMALVGEAPAFQYDLASAYPKGLTDCLSLAPITWRHSHDATYDDRHALYHVTWRVRPFNEWNPFPWRSKDGAVLYPYEGEGWYWGTEILAAEKTFPHQIRRIEAWYPSGERLFPFAAAIERDYTQRYAIGKDSGAGKAIRLGLNSLYGKLCQHVTEEGKIPRWQNYIWAGYTTAHTRARILDAIRCVGQENVLAIATDGVFTRIPLPTEPHQLGAWENKGFAITLFVAPGMYAVLHDDTPSVVKKRGMPSNLNYGYVLRSWGCMTERSNPGLDATVSPFTMFVGMGHALAQPSLPWGTFRTTERSMQNVTVYGTSKRFPSFGMIGQAEWMEFPLHLRPRTESVISYPYEWRAAWDPKENKEE